MNVVLENCLINAPVPPCRPLTRLHQEMCGLVLHYDQSESNVCEATGLVNISQELRHHSSSLGCVKGVKRLVILVSPSYYFQRKRFYGPNFEVRPLLFSWSSLCAQQLKKLMRLKEGEGQLYVSVMLDMLRGYQRSDRVPAFKDFLAQVMEKCKVKGQSGPLGQRLNLLQSIVKESAMNASLLQYQKDLASLMSGGTLVVCDLTDPMLSADEANGIFQVMLEQFRIKSLHGCGKVVAFDEAHKYLTTGGGSTQKDELAGSILNTVRLMRHEGIRVLISTQSPLALPSELLELVTVTAAHHFQSSDWYQYLSSKIPMPIDGFEAIKKLETGEALVVSTKTRAKLPICASCDGDNSTWLLLRVRYRITADYGSSKQNACSAAI